MFESIMNGERYSRNGVKVEKSNPFPIDVKDGSI